MSIHILILDNNSKFISNLKEQLTKYGATVHISPPLVTQNFRNYDGLVVSGRSSKPASSSLRRLIIEYYERLFYEFDKPILGICFGHEVLAFVYGGLIRKMQKGEYGITPITFHENYILMNGVSTTYVYQGHSAEVTKLPGCIQNFACSQRCRNQVVMHKEKPQFGVQFHPEVTQGDSLLRNFVSYCSGNRLET